MERTGILHRTPGCGQPLFEFDTSTNCLQLEPKSPRSIAEFLPGQRSRRLHQQLDWNSTTMERGVCGLRWRLEEDVQFCPPKVVRATLSSVSMERYGR